MKRVIIGALVVAAALMMVISCSDSGSSDESGTVRIIGDSN